MKENVNCEERIPEKKRENKNEEKKKKKRRKRNLKKNRTEMAPVKYLPDSSQRFQI